MSRTNSLAASVSRREINIVGKNKSIWMLNYFNLQIICRYFKAGLTSQDATNCFSDIFCVPEIIHRRLGFPFNLEFTYPAAIERSAAGKFEDFISLA